MSNITENGAISIETLPLTKADEPDCIRLDHNNKEPDCAELLQEDRSWQRLFHTYDEIVNAPPLRFAIEGFLPEDGITLFGGLAGHGKTFLMLNIVKALLEGEYLFGHVGFAVARRSKRVLYLIPESALGPFIHRLELFKLCDFVRQGMLFIRTLSAKEPMNSLSDPRLKEAAQEADIFLDTVIRFMSGDENSSSDNRDFARVLFTLQSAGAKTISGAHHSPKAFGRAEEITLENALRGGGDVGAMLSTAWALRQIDRDRNRIFVQNIKARDFEACQSFVLEGRPHIDETGSFKMITPPGEVKAKGRRQSADKEECVLRAKSLKADGWTDEEVGREVGKDARTIRRWRGEGLLPAVGCPPDIEDLP